MFSRRFGSVTALLVCLTATTLGGGDEINGDQDILAIGDSLLDFHTPDADIATVAAEELGLSVELAASGGTTMLDEDGIPQTYVDGSFSVLIASGGGNQPFGDGHLAGCLGDAGLVGDVGFFSGFNQSGFGDGAVNLIHRGRFLRQDGAAFRRDLGETTTDEDAITNLAAFVDIDNPRPYGGDQR